MKWPIIREINGVTRWANGTVVYRIRFDGQSPIYPEGFAWETGANYAHVQAGGGWRPCDVFAGEPDFLQSVADDPIEPGWTRLVARLPQGGGA